MSLEEPNSEQMLCKVIRNSCLCEKAAMQKCLNGAEGFARDSGLLTAKVLASKKKDDCEYFQEEQTLNRSKVRSLRAVRKHRNEVKPRRRKVCPHLGAL